MQNKELLSQNRANTTTLKIFWTANAPTTTRVTYYSPDGDTIDLFNGKLPATSDDFLSGILELEVPITGVTHPDLLNNSIQIYMKWGKILSHNDKVTFYSTDIPSGFSYSFYFWVSGKNPEINIELEQD